MKRLKQFFPILSWGRSYSTTTLKGDLLAGLTVGVYLIPQGMAYAMLAGLPPVIGLYASFFPILVYTFMGTSPKLAVGPVALDSLLVASGLGAMSFSNSSEYIVAAVFLAFFVGLLQMILGGLRLGFLIRYLSKPVVSGFSSAAALIIGVSQLSAISGFTPSHKISAQNLFFSLSEFSFIFQSTTFYVGLGAVIFLLFFKHVFPRFPAALLLIFLASILSFVLDWDNKGVDVVGYIPEGLPEMNLPTVSASQWLSLTPLAFTLALIAFMEVIAVSRSVEEQKSQISLRPNQEFIALGAANMFGSFFQSYPISGGFSRTAVNSQLGANTPLSGFISALLVGSVLLFFTDYFYHLPLAVLGAIIIVAVVQLVNIRYPKELWMMHRVEFYVLCITFFCTLLMGIKYGLLFGVLSSLAHTVYRDSKPHIAVLGRVEGTNHFKNISRFSSDVITYPKVLILRYDGSLFFGNLAYFKREIKGLLQKQKISVRHLIIDASPIHYIDATALNMLHHWIKDLENNHIRVFWAQVTGPVRDVFYKSGITDSEQQTFFSSLDAAMKHLEGNEPDFCEDKISNQVNS